MFTDSTIIIPARKNSKGLPFKNRTLFEYTATLIPVVMQNNVWVSTDDEQIIQQAKSYGFNVDVRPDHLALDTTSIKQVLIDLQNRMNFGNQHFITLYLTYPERSWDEVYFAYNELTDSNSVSLLCKKKYNGVHPFLIMYEQDNSKGKQLVPHDLYRRQDYPSVFEISHYIQIAKWSELTNLNENLYNDKTHFYKIKDVIDVDYDEDIRKFYNNL